MLFCLIPRKNGEKKLEVPLWQETGNLWDSLAIFIDDYLVCGFRKLLVAP